MFRLEIVSPLDGEGELFLGLQQDIDSFGICDYFEGGIGHGLQTPHQLRLDKAGKKLQILTAVVQSHADKLLYESLGQFDIVFQVVERHFGFYHPELGKMAAGVENLRPECRPEGIHPTERQGINLGLKLAAHGEKCRPGKKVGPGKGVRVEIFALRRAGPGRVERGYAEDFPRAFTVARSNYRRMNIAETPVLEELVNSVAQPVSHPCGRANRVGPGPQVSWPQGITVNTAISADGNASGAITYFRAENGAYTISYTPAGGGTASAVKFQQDYGDPNAPQGLVYPAYDTRTSTAAAVNWVNPSSVQIFASGMDTRFGNISVAAYPALAFPAGSNYLPFTFDDITNFSGGKLEDSIP